MINCNDRKCNKTVLTYQDKIRLLLSLTIISTKRYRFISERTHHIICMNITRDQSYSYLPLERFYNFWYKLQVNSSEDNLIRVILYRRANKKNRLRKKN